MNSAIVVLNWNDWKNTVDCLESIYQNDGKFDVFLVDNGSYQKNILKISSWHKGLIISDRNFVKPRINNQGKLISMNFNNNIFDKKKMREIYIYLEIKIILV